MLLSEKGVFYFGYIIGLARNARLQSVTEFMELAMKDSFEKTGSEQREVGEFVYAAQSWAKERRVITRLEYGEQGNNPRYVVSTRQKFGAPFIQPIHLTRLSMQLFLNEVSARQPGERIVMVIDGAGWHRSDALKAPKSAQTATLCARAQPHRAALG
jgi:Transposase DDE domain group 1